MSLQQPLAPELEAKAQELLTHLRAQADDELLALARLLVSKGDTMKSSAIPSSRLGTSSTASAPKPLRRTSLKKNGYEGSGVVCPHCEQSSKYHGQRSKGAYGLMGDVRAGLLLLRALRPRRVALGQPGRLDRAVVRAGRRAAGQLGRSLER
jgi:hypothetical protein